MHEDDQDVTAEDCETELSIIWSDFFACLFSWLYSIKFLIFTFLCYI